MSGYLIPGFRAAAYHPVLIIDVYDTSRRDTDERMHSWNPSQSRQRRRRSGVHPKDSMPPASHGRPVLISILKVELRTWKLGASTQWIHERS